MKSTTTTTMKETSDDMITSSSSSSSFHLTILLTLIICVSLTCSILLPSHFTPLTVAQHYIDFLLTSTDASQRLDFIAAISASFSLLYGLTYLMWRTIPGTGLQSPALAKIAASRCISTTHAAIVVCFGIVTVCRQLSIDSSWSSIQSLNANTALEHRVLEVSGGFFIVDIAVLLMNTRCRLNDQQSILLFCHHVISLTFMLTVGFYSHAASMVMVGLIFAESTSPVVTLWTLARATKSKRHLQWTSPLFTVLFTIMRYGGMTMMLIDAAPKLIFGVNEGEVPLAMRATWCFILILLCIGGWIWAYEAQKGLRSYYRKQRLVRMQVAPLDASFPVSVPSADSASPSTSPVGSPFLTSFMSPQSPPRSSLSSLDATVCG